MIENIPCQLVKSFPFPFYLQIISGITYSSHTPLTYAPTSTLHTVRRQAPAAQPSQARQASVRFAPRLHPRIALIALRSHRSLSFLIWCRRPLLILIYLSLSLPSSLNLIRFDDFFLVGFCFFCVYLLRNDIIYLFGS